MALKQKKFLIILLIFIAALFTLYKLQFETRKEIDKIVKEKVERVRVFTAKPGSFATKIRVFAKLYSEKEINIISDALKQELKDLINEVLDERNESPKLAASFQEGTETSP